MFGADSSRGLRQTNRPQAAREKPIAAEGASSVVMSCADVMPGRSYDWTDKTDDYTKESRDTYTTFTSICLGIAALFFGSVTVSIPSLNSARTLVPSTNVGSVKILMNSPYFRSMR